MIDRLNFEKEIQRKEAEVTFSKLIELYENPIDGDFDKTHLCLIHEYLFKDLYVPYKNYKEGKIKVYNQKDKDMLKLQELYFIINDLNLYLDLYPEDNKAFNYYKSIIKEYNKSKEEYVKKYGPIDLLDETEDYEWTVSTFPWEDENV